MNNESTENTMTKEEFLGEIINKAVKDQENNSNEVSNKDINENNEILNKIEEKATKLYEQCKDFMREVNIASVKTMEDKDINFLQNLPLSPLNAFILSYERDHNMTVKRKVTMTESATFVVEGPSEDAINDFIANNTISEIEEKLGININREYSEMTEACDLDDQPIVVLANYLNE